MRATLRAMSRLTKIYRSTPKVLDVAQSIVATVPEKNTWLEIAAVQEWVRDHVRYTSDVFDVETLRTPPETLRTFQGDCDDKALLAGTLLQALGVKVRYVAVGYEAADQFEHVYVEAIVGGHWVPVETTESVSLGWVPAPPVARMVEHI